MSVSYQHDEYREMLPTWKRCRDTYIGTRALREATTEYLPMLTDETPEAYRSRLSRSVLYNATYRTISGLVGALFRIPPVLSAPETTTAMTADITMTGIPLNVLTQEIADECLVVGRVGIYTNYPVTDTYTMTQADAIALNLRPSLSIVKAEQITNWKNRRVNNKYILSLAVIKEEFLEPENEFKDKEVVRYRVLDLDENNNYRVRIMAEDDKGNDILVEGPFYPEMNGKRMQFIPLTIIGPENIDSEIDAPILVDLVDTNLIHYQAMSDLIGGCHWSAIPTMLITGHEIPEGGKLTVGAGKALVLPNPAAKATMVEVGTAGFSALDSLLNRLEQHMVALGSRALESHRVQAESADTAMIYRSGEQSILATMSTALSTGITAALKVFSEWAGDDASEVRFTLNKEFFKDNLSPEMLKALVESWQLGGISAESKFRYLQQHEFIPPHISFEKEEQMIKEGLPKTPEKPAIITQIKKNSDGNGYTAVRAA